jgi:hypothetical protein
VKTGPAHRTGGIPALSGQRIFQVPGLSPKTNCCKDLGDHPCAAILHTISNNTSNNGIYLSEFIYHPLRLLVMSFEYVYETYGRYKLERFIHYMA